jgi:hypothetical protein
LNDWGGGDRETYKRLKEKAKNALIDTPVKNLLIGSCWSHQIGGVPSAVFAAKGCFKKIK